MVETGFMTLFLATGSMALTGVALKAKAAMPTSIRTVALQLAETNIRSIREGKVPIPKAGKIEALPVPVAFTDRLPDNLSMVSEGTIGPCREHDGLLVLTVKCKWKKNALRETSTPWESETLATVIRKPAVTPEN